MKRKKVKLYCSECADRIMPREQMVSWFRKNKWGFTDARGVVHLTCLNQRPL